VPTTVPLDKSRHNRNAFSCGVEQLDRYLHEQAAKDSKRGVSVCWVLADEDDPTLILGFYTLSNFAVILTDLPEEMQKRLPKYPHVPATLLGRLAVSQDNKGQGLGEFLLMDALRRSLETSEAIASNMVVADPKDEESANFYKKYDFRSIQEDGQRLYLPMKTIASVFVD